jgi:hypothetical protein
MNPVEVPPAARSLWGAGGSSRGGDPGMSHSWDVHRRLEGPVGQSCQLRGASTAPWRRKRWRWRSHDTTSSIKFHHINNENDRLIYSWHSKTANFMWHCDLCWFFSCFFCFQMFKTWFHHHRGSWTQMPTRKASWMPSGAFHAVTKMCLAKCYGCAANGWLRIVVDLAPNWMLLEMFGVWIWMNINEYHMYIANCISIRST